MKNEEWSLLKLKKGAVEGGGIDRADAEERGVRGLKILRDQ
jgi:hypothetical protein